MQTRDQKLAAIQQALAGTTPAPAPAPKATPAFLFQPAPSRENYAAWYKARQDRAHAAIKAGRTRITGREVREESMSLKVLYDNGYILDVPTDTMVKA